MTFDPETLDLSFVEPAAREEVVRRIVALEAYLAAPSPAARRRAQVELGITGMHFGNLLRAWTMRGRAEDVTVRGIRRARAPDTSPELLAIIKDVVDPDPFARTRTIAAEVAARARAAGLTPPGYPTIARYVRDALAAGGGRLVAELDRDVVVDATASAIPVLADDGSRVRPQLVAVIDGRAPSLASLVGTAGDLEPQHVARALIDAASPALAVAAGIPDAPFSISLPTIPGFDPEPIRRAVAAAGATVDVRPPSLTHVGRAASAILGSRLAGYPLSPRLVGRPVGRRAALDPRQAAVPVDEAVAYLAVRAGEGRQPAASPFVNLDPLRLSALVRGLRAVA